MPEELVLPEAVRAYLEKLVRMRFSTRDPEPVLAALPASLPAGEVRKLVRGGAFGWMLEARLDDVDGRLALECLEDSRMAGPDHYRVWEDGELEALPTEHTSYGWRTGASEAEIDAARQRMYEHNRTLQAELRERGFGP